MSCRLSLSTYSMAFVSVPKDIQTAHQGSNQVKGSHTNADIVIFDTSKDYIPVLSHQVRMGGHDFDHCEQSDVPDCMQSHQLCSG